MKIGIAFSLPSLIFSLYFIRFPVSLLFYCLFVHLHCCQSVDLCPCFHLSLSLILTVSTYFSPISLLRKSLLIAPSGTSEQMVLASLRHWLTIHGRSQQKRKTCTHASASGSAHQLKVWLAKNKSSRFTKTSKVAVQ